MLHFKFMTFKNVQQLLDHFKDEATCKAYLEQKRWGGVPACHHCGSVHVYRTNRGFKCAEKLCGKKFSVLTGTVYENTKLPLRTWFAGLYLCSSSKKGISSLQASRQLGITQKSAWFLNHRIRQMLKNNAPQLLNETVQLDETYVGGRAANKHKSKRLSNEPYKRYDDKAPVIGIVDNNGKVILKAIPWVTKRTIAKIIETHIGKGSTMVTDSHIIYKHLANSPYYNHKTVNHNADEYVNKEGYHTNRIEGVFSIFKRGIFGIYHSVSSKHLQKYCDEFALRYNTRLIGDDERFNNSLENCNGRLKYKDLTKKL